MDYLTGIASSSPFPDLAAEVEPMANVLGDGASQLERTTSARAGFAVAFRADPYAPDSRFLRLEKDTLVYLYGSLTLLRDGGGELYWSAGSGDESLARQIVDRYEALGPSAFCSASGSFLLLIHHPGQGRTTIVSDRLASRPLFYWQDAHRIVFATDIRAILATPFPSRCLDLRSVVEFLRFTMILEDRTLYDDVSLLPPATVLTVDRGGISATTYWTMRFAPVPAEPGALSDYARRLAETFVTAADRTTRGLDAVGLMLSGGLDSRMIAAALHALGKKPFLTLTFADFENVESRLARRVAEDLDFEYVVLMRPPGYYHQLLSAAVEISNGAYLSLHGHMLGLKDQVRSLGIRTLLWGWGLDLLFGASYWPRRSVHVLGKQIATSWLRPLPDGPSAAASLLSQLGLARDELTSDLFSGAARTLWREWPRQVCDRLVDAAEPRANSPYDQLDLALASDFANFRSFIFALSLRHCARERCVMLDNDLLDLFLQMPPWTRAWARAYRRALALLDPRLARIPDAKTGVSYAAPVLTQAAGHLLTSLTRSQRIQKFRAEHPDYPVSGVDSYPNPTRLLRQKDTADMVGQALLGGRYLDLAGLKLEVVERMLSMHRLGQRDYGYHLCALYTLALWLERWG